MSRDERPVWSIPLRVAAVSALGLLSALLGDGAWDVFCWICLSVPLVVIARAWLRREATPGPGLSRE